MFINQSEGGLSYYWDFGDGNTSEEENPVHSYMENGTYLVQLITIGRCASDTITIDIEVIITSVHAPERYRELVVVPNPTTGQFILQGFTFSPDARIGLIDMLGRTASYHVDGDGAFRLVDPVAGVYTLMIREGNSIFVGKIVVQR